MARPLRIQDPGALYHITSRGKEDYHDRLGILTVGVIALPYTNFVDPNSNPAHIGCKKGYCATIASCCFAFI